MSDSLLRRLLPLTYILLALLPGYVFFQSRGLEFLRGSDLKVVSVSLFPLLGLYAFFLVWAQIMIGSNLKFLRRLYPRVDHFHRFEGVFALLFALAHPSLLVAGVGIARYWSKEFVAPSQAIFVWLGQAQLLLLLITVGAALFMRLPWLRARWKYIHLLNYVVFILVWIHSWFLGSDVRATPLRYLWWFFALTFVGAVGRRIFEGFRGYPKPVSKPEPPQLHQNYKMRQSS